MNEYLKYPTPAHGSIPSFQNYEDEVAFWDSHDITEFTEETVPVNVRSTSGLTKQLMIRLDEETDRILEDIAAAEDIKKSTLIRKIIKTWLRQQQERPAS
ncbi:MAG TPA: CopG family antitoxin [Ktedonobacteraceae bacterium]|nr:CopG family antitoxin [Ktedonobacteraceae bacterium]